MATATLTKNGMINLPIEIRKKLKLKSGDKITFIDTDDGILILPLLKLSDLVDPKNKEITIQMVKELTAEHKLDAAKGR